MRSVLDTLCLPLTSGHVRMSDSPSILFYGAQKHDWIEGIGKGTITGVQPFFPYADALAPSGYQNFPLLSMVTDRQYDLVLALMPQSKAECRYILDQVPFYAKNDAVIVAAAANDAGGKSLQKLLSAQGYTVFHTDSKNKARVVCAHMPDNNARDEDKGNKDEGDRGENKAFAISPHEKLPFQRIQEGERAFISTPGIYGWEKIDKGSALLAGALPHDLKGRMADFGCGYGYLSCLALETNAGLTEIAGLDADYRALECWTQNMQNMARMNDGDAEIQRSCSTAFKTEWCDLTKPGQYAGRNYDVIVMNPPFHTGKKTDSDIGLSFIESAYTALKKGGALYMVANAHLPYESRLGAIFKSHEKLFETGGFKGYLARK